MKPMVSEGRPSCRRDVLQLRFRLSTQARWLHSQSLICLIIFGMRNFWYAECLRDHSHLLRVISSIPLKENYGRKNVMFRFLPSFSSAQRRIKPVREAGLHASRTDWGRCIPRFAAGCQAAGPNSTVWLAGMWHQGLTLQPKAIGKTCSAFAVLPLKLPKGRKAS